SAILIVIAFYVRLKISETAVFASETANANADEPCSNAAPLLAVLRWQRRKIVLAAGSVLGGFGFVYLASTYLTSYAQTHLGYSRNFVLIVGVLGGLTSIVFVWLTASLCDRFGRRRVMLTVWAVALPWSLVVMPLIDSGFPALFAAAVLSLYATAAAGFGPVGALMPELFATRYRYTGTALAFNLAGIVGGAVPPLIAGTLLACCGSWAIGLMLMTLVAASLVCTYLLPETVGTILARR
ncbi:MFS transporter, partial [Mycobacterium simiae]